VYNIIIYFFKSNQISILNSLNIPAKSLNSSLKATEKREILDDLHSESPKIKMLYGIFHYI